MSNTFQSNLAAYKSLIDANDPSKLTQIQNLNRILASQINSMLEQSSGDMRASHSALIQRLVGLQNDASIMRQQRDQYKTLQMLQNNEHATFSVGFFWYSLSLGLAAILFVLVLMWKGGYKAPMMPAMTSSPTTANTR
jgi:hypothetical protein